MNLQDLRDELATRADSVDQHAPDLLPGVRQKIRRTRQRRTFTALGIVAVLAGVVAGLMPALTSTTQPADKPPADYTRDDVTVPGVVGNDRLLKAWIGDRGQDKISFTWTPTTTALTFHGECQTTGSGMYAIRYTINGWYVGPGSCDAGPSSWTMGTTASVGPDHPLWLDAPLGKPVQVTAEIVDLDTQRPGGESPRIALGIYSSGPTSATTDGAPLRVVPPGSDDYQKDGVTYRKRIGGDTLAGAELADQGQREVRFSFTSTGATLALHPFCTANKGSDSMTPPYSVKMRIAGRPVLTSCAADSIDPGVGTGVEIASPVPAGQRVDVIAEVTSAAGNTTIPADARLGLGVYFKGEHRSVDGVQFPERLESSGYTYRLAEVRTAAGPSQKVSITTPADQPYVLAYGSSPLGIATRGEAQLTVGKTDTGVSTDPSSVGSLGLGWDAHGSGPAGQATLTITEGTPTKGTLILAVYLPD
ncbi:hypothetical protein [Kribbella sp. NPDC048915]|uniref:hypothetical protein n=1 Tax=Kribbella sp. NPDC048915 TaxID=3155148 RepID=UPI003410C4B6